MKYTKLLVVTVLFVLLTSMSGCRKQETVEGMKLLAPNEKLQQSLKLDQDCSLEIWKGFIALKKQDRTVYKELIKANDTASVFLVIPSSQVKVPYQLQNDLASLSSILEPPISLVIEYQKFDQMFEYHVFLVGRTIKKVAVIPNGYSRWCVETAEKGKTKILANDWYTDWGAEAVAPRVILKWNGHSFALDIEAMKNKAISIQKLSLLEHEIREQFTQFPENPEVGPIGLAPPELASTVFDLYYHGQGAVAPRFYDHCWPIRKPGKKAYWSFLVKKMKQSPYGSYIEEINRIDNR